MVSPGSTSSYLLTSSALTDHDDDEEGIRVIGLMVDMASVNAVVELAQTEKGQGVLA